MFEKLRFYSSFCKTGGVARIFFIHPEVFPPSCKKYCYCAEIGVELHQRQQQDCSSVADQEERREIRLHENRNNTGIFISISLGNDFTRIFSFSALGQKV